MTCEQFSALMIHEDRLGPERAVVSQLTTEDLMQGQVEIAVEYSSLNYKDALAITGGGRILRHSPLIGGIDAAGRVLSSRAGGLAAGTPVLVTGCGLGELRHGGFSGRIRVPADWVMPLPQGMDARQAMVLGTAGLTAALALSRLEDNRQDPASGPVLVTGASGGVGSLAVAMLAAQGYEVVALTGKPALTDWLKGLGAARVLDRAAFAQGKRPLEKARWGGVVDTVGGDLLGSLTRSVRPWGNIVSIGLAGGADLHTTVMPFILRGVSLLGVSSADCPRAQREHLWQRLASDLRPPRMETIETGSVGLGELVDVSERMLAGRTHGRILVCPG
jgi:NADPH2:quinone reductase